MVGNINSKFSGSIVLPNGMGGGNIPAPGDISEDQFINLLNAGVYDSSYIGSTVTLANSVDYNNGKWVIADVNHDSANTGQTNCYDLITVDCFYSTVYGNNNHWRSSTPRTWLNNTFYFGFSTDFKSHILNLKYNSEGTWYNDDKIIIPSKSEIKALYYTEDTSIAYPIFTWEGGSGYTGPNNSRIKYNNNNADYWWTRSRALNSVTNGIWSVNKDGSVSIAYWQVEFSHKCSLSPILRVS